MVSGLTDNAAVYPAPPVTPLDLGALVSAYTTAKNAKKEAGNTQTKEETKTISQKEYEDYQRYLAEKDTNKSQESTTERE